MNTPTLYPEALVLAAAAYPGGFSRALLALCRIPAHAASTPVLAALAAPPLVVALAAWCVRPELLVLRGSAPVLLAAAACGGPLALLVEYALQVLARGRASRGLPRIALPRFWQAPRTTRDYALLVLIAGGEEVLYRQLWLGALWHIMGLPALLALAISASAYGVNHLAFGLSTVASKAVTGLLYGGLYLVSGGSLLPPLVAHALQNALLFRLAEGRHA